ncbi:MAG: hypothetical protein KAS87_03995 [Candidatus Omnitrophica bacterium]|nr:hypothetical protein [Candidatus Omnitrophota bacterium]
MKKLNSKGFALVAIIIFSILLLTTLIISLNFVFSHYGVIEKREAKEREHYLEEAGRTKGEWIIDNGAAVQLPNQPFNNAADYVPGGSAGLPDAYYEYNGWQLTDAEEILRTIKITITGDVNEVPAAIPYKVIKVEVVN